MEKYVFPNYICLHQTKLSFENKIFESTTFNNISVISIPELLITIISCHGFDNDIKSTVILSWYRKMVGYYM